MDNERMLAKAQLTDGLGAAVMRRDDDVAV